jgi:hypothetical protein
MWLRCQISPGQFSGEYAIRGTLFNGAEFSLFAEKSDVELSGELSMERPIDGWLRVTSGPQEGNLLLVSLPQPSFENGQVITVKKEQVRV